MKVVLCEKCSQNDNIKSCKERQNAILNVENDKNVEKEGMNS